MANVDEVAASLGANKSEAEGLAGQLAASKQQTEELQIEIAALGAEGAANRASAAAQAIDALMTEATGLADRIGEAQAQVLAIKEGGLLTTAATSTGSPRPPTHGSRPTRRGERTRPSHPPNPNRRPGGRPEPIDPRASPDKQTGIRGENDAAIVLARSGYDIAQRPPPKPNGKRPDYFMEGDYWDCYTVVTRNSEQVRRAISKKANPERGPVQASRIIVNFDSSGPEPKSSLTPETIEALLQRKPVNGLKEVKVILNGRVRNLDLGA
ncbi:hypothetical protein [Glycomyces sp. NRRL B-16210]|uniref:CdiA C-terminal domain-containing protein n=1 Tax=Glycomyces sp. NRRL B-16210 TaxID=1463821 RepID=UPI001061D87C|nr:hypothetical protein [Glycomyces sp. NRRL B-16210]